MRLVDLHCDWLRQYATETTLHEGSLYPEVPGRVGRLDGYLLGTSLAVLACSRKPEDWARQADPWLALGQMIARYEAEFPGRILRDVEDAPRWRSSPRDELCWGVIGVAGLDLLVRDADGLNQLPTLFGRGVRVFQPIASEDGILGGAATMGGDRGLTELGRAVLDRLAGLATSGPPEARPILDLAGMNRPCREETLSWLEEAPTRREAVLLSLTHGTIPYRDLLDPTSPESHFLAEFRRLGGVLGLTPGRAGFEAVEELKGLVDRVAALPFEGRPGHEGLAIGSDLLGPEHPAPGLSTARDLARSVGRVLDRDAAAAILSGNARRLLLCSVGADPHAHRTGD